MKKIMALLLALMVLFLPVVGGAEAAVPADQATRTSVTFTPGDLSMLLGEYESAYEDLLNALQLSLYNAGDQASITMSLSDAQVFYAALGFDDTLTTYLASNFLSDTPLAVAMDEWELLGDKLMELLVATEAMTAEEAAAFRESLTSTQNSSSTELATAFITVDWTPVITKALTFAEKAQTEAVTQQPENCDTAATKLTLSLSATEITDLLEAVSSCLQADENAMAYLESMVEDTATTAAAYLDATIAELRTAAVDSDETLEIVCYLNEQGEVVRLDSWNTGSDSGLKANYCRQTLEQGVQHEISFAALEDGAELLSLSGKYLSSDTAPLFSVALNIGDSTGEVIAINAEVATTDGSVDVAVSINLGTEAIDLTVASTETESDSHLAAELSVTADGKTAAFALTINRSQTPSGNATNAKGDATLTITASGISMDLIGSYTTTADPTADVLRTTDADLSFQIMGMEMKIASLHAVTETCAPEASIASDDALHLATMTTDELEAFATQVGEQAQVALITLIQSLPTSVLTLMLGQ